MLQIIPLADGTEVYKIEKIMYGSAKEVARLLLKGSGPCYRFIKECPSSDTRYFFVQETMKILGEDFRELVINSKDIPLRNFAQSGLIFLQAIVDLFYDPKSIELMDNVERWYDNMDHRAKELQ